LAQLEGSTNTVELSSRIVLQLEPGRSLGTFLAGRSVTLARTIKSNVFILQAPTSGDAIDNAEALSQQKGVVASYPVMRRQLKRTNAYAQAPNDPEFNQEWHLENRGSDYNLAGPDLNVRTAWPVSRGENVLVAVADDGFQLDHPELVDRAKEGPHYNFYRNTSNGGPASSDANHATAVAGLIAAEANNERGVSGVAPQARLTSWVIFGTSFRGGDSIVTDEQLMDMFEYASNRVSVQNHSWGSASTAQLPIDMLSDLGIENAVTTGRGGKGVVMVRAGGNERENLTNVNDDGYASDPRVIAVAAVRKDGRACSYSSPGACLLVAAPSGDVIDRDGDGQPDAEDPDAPDVLTTDRTAGSGYNTDASDAGDYAFFNGTSASTPQVAGVVARCPEGGAGSREGGAVELPRGHGAGRRIHPGKAIVDGDPERAVHGLNAACPV
jgi:subtilisin family serine protease